MDIIILKEVFQPFSKIIHNYSIGYCTCKRNVSLLKYSYICTHRPLTLVAVCLHLEPSTLSIVCQMAPRS